MDMVLPNISSAVSETFMTLPHDFAILRPSVPSSILKVKGFDAQSPLLKRIASDLGLTADTRQELEKIKLRFKRLEDAVVDQSSTYAAKTVVTAQNERYTQWVREGKTVPKKRQFNLGGDTAKFWLWIDFDDEWP